MSARIALLTILTDDVPGLVRFYRDVLGIPMKDAMGDYVEFDHPGVRFAICSREVMANATAHPDYQVARSGQSFELAFPLESSQEVDQEYQRLLERGAVPVKGPADMPWGQRTAFFADPDGNIHELFAELPKSG